MTAKFSSPNHETPSISVRIDGEDAISERHERGAELHGWRCEVPNGAKLRGYGCGVKRCTLIETHGPLAIVRDSESGKVEVVRWADLNPDWGDDDELGGLAGGLCTDQVALARSLNEIALSADDTDVPGGLDDLVIQVREKLAASLAVPANEPATEGELVTE